MSESWIGPVTLVVVVYAIIGLVGFVESEIRDWRDGREPWWRR